MQKTFKQKAAALLLVCCLAVSMLAGFALAAPLAAKAAINGEWFEETVSGGNLQTLEADLGDHPTTMPLSPS